MVFCIKKKQICIICFECCNDSFCNCKAFFHKDCYNKWNKSESNNNKNSCPHCFENLILEQEQEQQENNQLIKNQQNINCSCYLKLNNIKEKFNKIYNNYYNKIHFLISIFICLSIPLIIGLIILIIKYYTSDDYELMSSDYQKKTLKEYLLEDIFIVYLFGIFGTIIILHIWAKCKNGDCKLDDSIV